MNRWVILAGLVVASVLMFQVQSGKIGTDDIFGIFRFDSGEVSEERGDLEIMAFGDMMFGRYVRILMEQGGMGYVFGDGISDLFDDVDVVFANLEGPIHGEGKKGGTSMNFSFNEDIGPFLKNNGFDVVTIANNHSLDQGWEGRATTIFALDRIGVGWCGHPTEVDYDSIYYGKAGDKTFAFMCFNDVGYNLDEEAAVSLIEEVSRNVDYAIVTIHWGIEYNHYPDWGLQIEPAHAFVDAGADFVIGHHPHVVQSFEEYNGKLIFYSLGNFVFDQYWSTETQEELGIKIGFYGENVRVELFPMKSEFSRSRVLNEDEYAVWIEEFLTYGDYDDEMKEQIRSGVIEVNM